MTHLVPLSGLQDRAEHYIKSRSKCSFKRGWDSDFFPYRRTQGALF